MELWRDIPDYENLYQVSNLGNVRKVLKSGKTKPVNRRNSDECSPQSINLSKKGKKTSKSVMMLVFYSFIFPELSEIEKNRVKSEKLSKRILKITPKDGKMSNCSQKNLKIEFKNESQLSELSEFEQNWVKKTKYVYFFKSKTENWYFRFRKSGALTLNIPYADGNFDTDFLLEKYDEWLEENSPKKEV